MTAAHDTTNEYFQTLYKIARKEKIELAQPFNALATNWTPIDLNNALDDIKNGLAVQKAAAKFGIPSGTLYGRCKKVGIELSKSSKFSKQSIYIKIEHPSWV